MADRVKRVRWPFGTTTVKTVPVASAEVAANMTAMLEGHEMAVREHQAAGRLPDDDKLAAIGALVDTFHKPMSEWTIEDVNAALEAELAAAGVLPEGGTVSLPSGEPTPAMIAAGAHVIAEVYGICGADVAPHLARDVFLAMVQVREEGA